MSLGIYGAASSIARAILPLLPAGEEVTSEPGDPFHARFLFCSGYLPGKTLTDLPAEEISRAFHENFASIAATCDVIFEHNSEARVCIIGSQSGIAGSHDMAYAGAKAAMHLYIKTKRLQHPGQQIVGIAPTIIWDSGMTQRRPDLDALAARGKARRAGRWLSAAEVAAAAHFLLYVDLGYVSNTILRMTGGEG